MAVPVLEASTALGETLSASCVLSVPAGTVAGDVLVAGFYAEEASITAPAGWTVVESAVDTAAAPNSTVSGHVYVRVATGSEPSTYTWSWSGSDYHGGAMLRVSGVDTADIVNASRSRTRQAGGTGADENAATSNTISIPALTTDAADCLGVAFIFSWAVTSDTATATGWTAGSGYEYGRVFTRPMSTATTYSQVDTSVTNEATSSVSIVLALNPAAASGPTGTGAPTMARHTASGSGSTAAPSTTTGSGAPTLARHTAAGSGSTTVPPTSGTGAPTLQRHTASGAGASYTGLHPRTVDATNKRLLDQNGDPWFGVGDTAWSLIGELTPTEIEFYLDEIAAFGVNFVLVNAPEHFFATNGTANYNNDEPFTGTAFQSSINDVYWQVLDDALDYALSLGITMLICPQYLGYAGTEEGWDTEIAAASNAQCTAYGEALAARYAKYPNIVWLIGHDQNPDATEEARSAAISDAIQAGTSHLVTIGSVRNNSAATDWASSGVDWDFSTVYTSGSDPGGETAAEWASETTIYLEGTYEAPGYSGDLGDQILREQLWEPLMAGASASIFGNSPRWHFGTSGAFGGTSTWENSLTSATYNIGTRHLGHLADFLAANPAVLSSAPDTTNTFRTAGTGAFARFNTTVGVVYAPGTGSITLDTTEMSGTAAVKIRRFDPTDGSYTTVAASESQNSGRVVTYPGTNSAGDTDWVYIIELSGSATGSSATTLARHTAAGSGTHTPPGGTGSGSPTLARHTGSGAGSTGTSGSGTPTCTRHTASGVGSTGLAGTAGVTLIRHAAAGSGTSGSPPSTSGSGLPALSRHTGTGSGSTGTSGSGTLLLARHTAVGFYADVAPEHPGLDVSSPTTRATSRLSRAVISSTSPSVAAIAAPRTTVTVEG